MYRPGARHADHPTLKAALNLFHKRQRMAYLTTPIAPIDLLYLGLHMLCAECGAGWHIKAQDVIRKADHWGLCKRCYDKHWDLMSELQVEDLFERKYGSRELFNMGHVRKGSNPKQYVRSDVMARLASPPALKIYKRKPQKDTAAGVGVTQKRKSQKDAAAGVGGIKKRKTN